MSKINKVVRKTFTIRDSGRSTDYISPSFGYGCLYNCTYCYMKRHLPEGLSIATNTGDILTAINNHVMFTVIDKPNQTDPEFITYDISCNEDFSLHAKYHDWKKIFTFFKEHPIAKGSFATKYVNKNLLEFNPNKKIRIRFSLMPQTISYLLEPHTSLIEDRINAINTFIEHGYDVHVNFSPIVVYPKWIEEYTALFNQLNDSVKDEFKKDVLAECIFLTHNESKHKANVINKLPGEELLWKPEYQESKVSQYGGTNIRYQAKLKASMITKFKELHKKIIPWNKIRYIF